MRHIKNSVFTILFLAILFLVGGARSEIVYYGFYESPLGKEFKRLKHQILGFEIDIPQNWNFGVSGTDELPVAILFPDGFDTSKLSNDYETIEIGRLPFVGISLEKAKKDTMLGMQVMHPNFAVIEEGKTIEISDLKAIQFQYKWTSKNGSEIVERVNLIAYEDQIRSVTIRVGKDKLPNFDKYQSFVYSYRPINFLTNQ